MELTAVLIALLSTTSAAPIPSPDPAPATAAVAAVTAMLNGLPSCANPPMNTMFSRAADFGCSDDDGVPDMACLCSNKPFKTEAKRSVSGACSAPADIGVSREWAISRCTAALTAAKYRAGVAKFPVVNDTSPDAPVGNSAYGVTSNPTVTAALSEAIFDIDDDEDWTNGAGLARAPGLLTLGLCVLTWGLLF